MASRKAIYIAIILILVVVVAVLAYVLLNKGSTPNSNSSADLKITQFERTYNGQVNLTGGDIEWLWTVSVKIENRGSNTVNGAELVVELKADHTTISSDSTTFTLQGGWSSTQHALIQARQSQWLGKTNTCVCTIYMGNEVIDQYTTSW
jgi:archaellin